jgi:hypothetical protein
MTKHDGTPRSWSRMPRCHDSILTNSSQSIRPEADSNSTLEHFFRFVSHGREIVLEYSGQSHWWLFESERYAIYVCTEAFGPGDVCEAVQLET